MAIKLYYYQSKGFQLNLLLAYLCAFVLDAYSPMQCLTTLALTSCVEVWLLFNLAYPFLIIVVNILFQVNLKTFESFLTNDTLQKISQTKVVKSSVKPFGRISNETAGSTLQKKEKMQNIAIYHVLPAFYIAFTFFYFLYYSSKFNYHTQGKI